MQSRVELYLSSIRGTSTIIEYREITFRVFLKHIYIVIQTFGKIVIEIF